MQARTAREICIKWCAGRGTRRFLMCCARIITDMEVKKKNTAGEICIISMVYGQRNRINKRWRIKQFLPRMKSSPTGTYEREEAQASSGLSSFPTSCRQTDSNSCCLRYLTDSPQLSSLLSTLAQIVSDTRATV